MAPTRPISDLSCEEPFRVAAGKVIWTRFEEMMSYREAALTEVEGIHDMRVASRRLRAALEIFGDVFPRRELKSMLRQIKELADTLGRVRDQDVLMERLGKDLKGRPVAQRQVLSEMIQEMQAQREQNLQALRDLLDRLRDESFSRRFLSAVARETM